MSNISASLSRVEQRACDRFGIFEVGEAVEELNPGYYYIGFGTKTDLLKAFLRIAPGLTTFQTVHPQANWPPQLGGEVGPVGWPVFDSNNDDGVIVTMVDRNNLHRLSQSACMLSPTGTCSYPPALDCPPEVLLRFRHLMGAGLLSVPSTIWRALERCHADSWPAKAFLKSVQAQGAAVTPGPRHLRVEISGALDRNQDEVWGVPELAYGYATGEKRSRMLRSGHAAPEYPLMPTNSTGKGNNFGITEAGFRLNPDAGGATMIHEMFHVFATLFLELQVVPEPDEVRLRTYEFYKTPTSDKPEKWVDFPTGLKDNDPAFRPFTNARAMFYRTDVCLRQLPPNGVPQFDSAQWSMLRWIFKETNDYLADHIVPLFAEAGEKFGVDNPFSEDYPGDDVVNFVTSDPQAGALFSAPNRYSFHGTESHWKNGPFAEYAMKRDVYWTKIVIGLLEGRGGWGASFFSPARMSVALAWFRVANAVFSTTFAENIVVPTARTNDRHEWLWTTARPDGVQVLAVTPKGALQTCFVTRTNRAVNARSLSVSGFGEVQVSAGDIGFLPNPALKDVDSDDKTTAGTYRWPIRCALALTDGRVHVFSLSDGLTYASATLSVSGQPAFQMPKARGLRLLDQGRTIFLDSGPAGWSLLREDSNEMWALLAQQHSVPRLSPLMADAALIKPWGKRSACVAFEVWQKAGTNTEFTLRWTTLVLEPSIHSRHGTAADLKGGVRKLRVAAGTAATSPRAPDQNAAGSAIVVIAIEMDGEQIELFYGVWSASGPIGDLHRHSISGRLVDCAVGFHSIQVLASHDRVPTPERDEREWTSSTLMHEFLIPPAMRDFWLVEPDPYASSTVGTGGIYLPAEEAIVADAVSNQSSRHRERQPLPDHELWVQHGVFDLGNDRNSADLGSLAVCRPVAVASRPDMPDDRAVGSSNAIACVTYFRGIVTARYCVEGGFVSKGGDKTFEDRRYFNTGNQLPGLQALGFEYGDDLKS